MNKNKIVITGGSGFIGTNIIEAIGKKASVFVIDKHKPLSKDVVQSYIIDLRNKEDLKILDEINPNVIIHLASSVNSKQGLEEMNDVIENNVRSTMNLYEKAASLKELMCVITLGSLEEYGNNTVPFTEDQMERPITSYSLSKTMMRVISEYFFRVHKLPIVFVRPSVVYGPHQKSNAFIPYIIQQCLRGESADLTYGEQTRDFLFVSDVVNAILKILENPLPCIGETLNVCSGEEIAIKKAAELIKELTLSQSELCFGKVPYKSSEIMRYVGSYNQARRILSWNPKMSFAEGIKRTIAWNKTHF